MILPDESIKKFQNLFEKEYGQQLTLEEARDGAQSLVGFFQVLFDIHLSEEKRRLRLKSEPKGFHLSVVETYNCVICRQAVSGENSWYDKNGIKCNFCQIAVNTRIIPMYVCKNRDSWYSLWQLSDYFGIKTQTAFKLVRMGRLKKRTILNTQGKPHYHLFLKKENLNTLDSFGNGE